MWRENKHGDPSRFITFFNISLPCNNSIPSFIGNPWRVLLLCSVHVVTAIKLCARCTTLVLLLATCCCSLQHWNFLLDKLLAGVVIRVTKLCKLQSNHVARQVARKCCPYHLATRPSGTDFARATLRNFSTCFLFKLFDAQFLRLASLRLLVLVVGSFFKRVFSYWRLFRAYLFLDLSSKFCVVAKTHAERLPHTSRFFFVELQISFRGQIGLKFVGKSACRTLADFLSRLTAFRRGAESISAMLEKTLVHETLMAISHWLRYARAPTKLSWSNAH